MSAAVSTDGAHVMVVDEADAFGERALGDLRHALPELRPVVAQQAPAARQRLACGRHGSRSRSRRTPARCEPIAFSRSRCGRRCLHLGSGVAPQQLGRIPAGDAGQAERLQRRLQRRRLARKLVAELHALEAGLAWPPRGRSRAASRRRARAGRRSTSRSDWRRCVPPLPSVSQSLLLQRGLPRRLARAASHLRALRHLRHRHVPPVAAGIGRCAADRCR